jgi:hypothetical protein
MTKVQVEVRLQSPYGTEVEEIIKAKANSLLLGSQGGSY